MTYQPEPIDVAHVALPASIRELSERLAENAHEIWAAKRMADGWTYGPQRDDAAKHHPDLVPYAELTEGEKDYDRKMVEGALKAILALGYRIEKG